VAVSEYIIHDMEGHIIYDIYMNCVHTDSRQAGLILPPTQIDTDSDSLRRLSQHTNRAHTFHGLGSVGINRMIFGEDR
jgi:hypothetical protein